jgi:hypothetical protein
VLATGPAAELAARYGEERYRITMSRGGQAALAALQARGLLDGVAVVDTTPGDWEIVECTIAGGAPRSAEIVSVLVELGVGIARFERVEPSLADLISRIISASGGGGERA